MELAPGIVGVPLRTPTLPPATHTNCWLVGEGSFLVIDPASPWDDERGRLLDVIRGRLAAGESLAGLLLTHHHHDHVAGAAHLRDALAADGVPAPVFGHPETAARVDVAVDRRLVDGDHLVVGGCELDVLHTPGHARGHLVLHDRASGAMVAGDMVAGVGTIAIDPDEGDLGDYLAQLERLRGRSPTVLLPAHGPALPHADAVLSMYIAHRHARSDQIRRALADGGPLTPDGIAAVVYPELPAAWQRLAARQVLSHLKWLAAHGVARAVDGERWSA